MEISNQGKIRKRILSILSDGQAKTKEQIHKEYESLYGTVKVATITGRCTDLRNDELIGLVKYDPDKEHPYGTKKNLRLTRSGASYFALATKTNQNLISFHPTRGQGTEGIRTFSNSDKLISDLITIMNKKDSSLVKYFIYGLLGDRGATDVESIELRINETFAREKRKENENTN